MATENKYLLSFTAASMRLNDSLKIARYILGNPGEDVKAIADPNTILGYGKSETNKREFRELYKRIKTLTSKQHELLAKGDIDMQRQIAFLAICKTYDFIRDFTIEVVREKALVFDYQINEGDYQSFLRRKQELHPELDSLAESTTKKLRQVMFRMLQEAGIINSTTNRQIQPQLLSTELVKATLEDNPNWLKIFLMSDMDIQQAIK